MASPNREFNALSGRELKAVIMKEIESAFDSVHDFTTDAVTFPVTRWTWKLDLQCYPREPQGIELQKTGAHVATDATPEEMTNTQPFELQGANAVGAEGMLAPDQAREQAGLPVPTLRTNKRLGTGFHEMVERPATDEESWTPQGVRSAIIDKGPRLRDKK